MQKLFLFLLLLFSCIRMYANDGSFYVNGNQLIPITETDIAVKKEILTIKRIDENYAKVTVYYEFYNPSEAKTLTVGFEADSPGGDVDPQPKNGEHPYMSDFTVKINSKALPYKVAMVDEELKKGNYVRNNKIVKLAPNEIKERIYEGYAGFYYVYHFDATFLKGINIVEHTYTVRLSGSVDHEFSLHYVLTAANRWTNKQIDDFTLIIDMGEMTAFHVENKSFGAEPKWVIEGEGKISEGTESRYSNLEYDDYELGATSRFRMKKGRIVFKQLNFVPKNELKIYSLLRYRPFDAYETYLSATKPIDEMYFPEAVDDFSKKVLRNLPFARRGYVFKSTDLKKYYSDHLWYKPNPDYKGSLEGLTKEEQEWVKRWSE